MIAFEAAGGGPPVVLVGGALSDRLSGAPLAALLAAHFTVLSYDRRGRGDSGDTMPYAVQREIEDIEALIAAAGGSVFVFGHSSGAALSLEAAASGLAIRKLALYEPPFIVDNTRPPLPRDNLGKLKNLIASGRRGDAVAYFFETGPLVPAEIIAQMRTSPMWSSFERIAHTLVYDVTIMESDMKGNPLPGDKWTSLRTPVLVMDGGASPAWARNSVAALAAAVPGASRRTLEGQTHGFSPAAIAPALEEFFATS